MVSLNDNLEFVIKYVFPMIVYIFGLLGNIMGMVLLSVSKKLTKLGPKDIYMYLFLTDTVYLSQLIINYLQFGWGYDVTILSSIACKIYQYFQYSTDAFSPYLIAYISVERLVSIQYPGKKEYFRKRRNQFIYFLIVVVYTCLLYLPYSFYTDVINTTPNSTKPVYNCKFVSYNSMFILNYLDIANRVLLPFVIMTVKYNQYFYSFQNINYISFNF